MADMKKHEILSPQSRAALFDPPTDPAAIVRHYTFSPDDMALIRERRRAANRLGFAVQLAYFRHPGRIMRVDEEPPVDMLAFIAGQVRCAARKIFAITLVVLKLDANISADLQACLNIRLARRADARPLFSVALNEAIGSDRGDAIVSAMIEHLRASRVLLPSPLELERVALSARALARKRAYKNLIERPFARDDREIGRPARRSRRRRAHAARLVAGMAGSAAPEKSRRPRRTARSRAETRRRR